MLLEDFTPYMDSLFLSLLVCLSCVLTAAQIRQIVLQKVEVEAQESIRASADLLKSLTRCCFIRMDRGNIVGGGVGGPRIKNLSGLFFSFPCFVHSWLSFFVLFVRVKVRIIKKII